jgi:hypothetical protein
MDYGTDGYDSYNVGNTAVGIPTEKAAAIIVIGSLLILILIRRGFRGVSVSGVGGIGVG